MPCSGERVKGSVGIPALFGGRNLLGKTPVFYDLPGFHPIKVNVDAWLAFMSSLGGDKDEVTLSQQKPDLVDRSMLHQHPYILQELRNAVLHAGFVPYHDVAGKVLVGDTVVPGDMKGLVVLAHERFVCLRFLQMLGLYRPVELCVPALIWTESPQPRKPSAPRSGRPQTNHVEEDVLASPPTLCLSDDVGPSSMASPSKRLQRLRSWRKASAALAW